MQVTDAMVAKALDAYVQHPAKDTAFDSMRAALTAALAEMWRPIEEAPKDETRVLLVRDDNPTMHTAFFRDGTWRCGGLEYFNKPTHWMPLPAPPMGK